MRHRVLLIGLGRIGLGYDLGRAARGAVLTHARAFSRHRNFKLVGGVDLDGTRRKAFEASYGVPASKDVSDAMRRCRPDVVVVATPTESHVETVRETLATGSPRAILCEKPLAAAPREAGRIVDLCRRRRCSLFANYMRRSDVAVEEVRRRLASGAIRLPVNGVVWYSKGLYNSASHFINLLEHLFGDVTGVDSCHTARPGKGVAFEPDFRLSFKGGTFSFIAARAMPLFHNSMEWIARNGRLRYERGGAAVFWDQAAADPLFAGYTSLSRRQERLPSDFTRIQWHVADQLARSLSGRPARICTGAAALRTIDVLRRIEDQYD